MTKGMIVLLIYSALVALTAGITGERGWSLLFMWPIYLGKYIAGGG